jgi:hypothetical protein
MALVVRLQITAGDGVRGLETLEVRRLTPLRESRRPADERHDYQARRYDTQGAELATAVFRHRYGDGAWMCVMRALMALTLSTRVEGAPIRSVAGFDLGEST